MNKYLALLRGINVGGKNIIAMKDLKKLFIDAGFKDASTYINSGNIIFSSSENEENELRKQLEELINKEFKLKISVLVIKSEDLVNAFNMAPDWWGKGTSIKHNAIFILPPLTARQALEKLEITEYEKIRYSGQVIFWSAKLKDFSKTKLARIIGTPLYNSITVRNYDTTMKLIELINSSEV